MTARASAIALASFMTFTQALAEDFRIAPYKEELYQYPKILNSTFGGDFVMIEFVKERDVLQRDEVELKKVHAKYVDLSVNEAKKDLTLKTSAGTVRYVGVGKTDGGAKIVVIFLHGLHGDRTLAMEDLRFGGNFNRLKNLMLRNDGVYITPDFANFGNKGTKEIKALIKHYAEISPGAPIIVACASTGCRISYRLLTDPETAALLGGIVLLGSLTANQEIILSDEVLKRRVPIYMAHGSDDPTVDWVTQEVFFKKVKAAAPDYPIKFALFVSANHGLVIRMIDWRLVLNWMLELDETG